MVSLAAVTLVTAGCAAGGAGIRTPVEEGHLHNYQLDEGMEIRFESVGEMSIEMDVPEMPIEQPIDMTFTSITCFEVEEMSEEGIKGVLVIEDMSLEGMGGMFPGAGFPLDQMKGMRIPVSMSERGKSEMQLSLEGMNLGGGMMNLPGGLSSYFIPWPEEPVRAGSTWTDTMTTDQNLGGVSVSFQMITEYTYLGLQGEEGVEDAPLAHKVHAAMSMTMGADTDVEEADMFISGTASGETDFYFDTNDGLLNLSRATMQMSMLMEMISPMEMTIPMAMNMIYTGKRLP